MQQLAVSESPPVKIGESLRQIRGDFPILRTTVRGKPLIYLDNAATSQKPQCVLDAIARYYSTLNANIHRGVHHLSEQATAAYEETRRLVKSFLHAGSASEIIFTRGTTEGINLVAATFGRQRVGPGDEIVLSTMEHHSNIVPWQMLCEEKGATLRIIPITDRGEIDFEAYCRLLSDKTRLVAIVHVSNSLGTINPVKEMIREAHAREIPVVVDGAQAVPHVRVDVAGLDCDFYTFSAHKVYGPTGIGVLYGKQHLLEAMPPYQGGGDMIRMVTFEKTTYNDLPHKFEAGTPNIAGVIGMGAGLKYVQALGYDDIAAHERELLDYATRGLSEIAGLRIIGTAHQKTGVISFVLDRVHPHDVGTFLDHEGIAVRTGHHCTQPLMQRFGVPATTRASFALYNTRDEIDRLVATIKRLIKFFA